MKLSERICSICGQKGFSPLATRSDGQRIVRCDECGMGVLETIPSNLSLLYDEQYYINHSCSLTEFGYSDYQLTSGHTVGWAVKIIQLFCKEGDLLDVGCADGSLLGFVDAKIQKFGIEVNEHMAGIARQRGVTIIGNDLLNAEMASRFAARFAAVTCIATLEHVSDIRLAVEIILGMLRPGGMLLFEVPLFSDTNDNQIWLTSSLEHVWYPSAQGLKQLIEDEFGWYLIGRELAIDNYGSTYIGIAVREAEIAAGVRRIADRVLFDGRPISEEEKIARLQTHLVHAAQTSHELIGLLPELHAHDLPPSMLRRLSELWQRDYDRLRMASAMANDIRANLRELSNEHAVLLRRFDDLTRDAARNSIELVEELTSLEARLAAAKLPVIAAAESVTDVRFASTSWNPPGAQLPVATEMSAFNGLPAATSAVVRAASPDLRPLKFIADRGHRYERLPTSEAEDGLRPPLVSVVIPSFNYGHFVDDAIASLLSQTFRDLEIIVVEGGSSDEASRLKVAELDRSRVRVLTQGPGHRVGANRNFGISQARGAFICCLDADDELKPTYIEKAVYLLERTRTDVVSSALEMFGKENQTIGNLERPTLDMLLEGNHVLTCAVFRRSLWVRSGGYRDTERTVTGYVYEDWSFWVRLAALGGRFLNMHNDALFRYRVHGVSLSRRDDVLSPDEQRTLIRLSNQDVITASALERSRRRAGERISPIGPAWKPMPRHVTAPAHPPTVLLAMPFLILGGAERLLSGIVRDLVQHGMRVVVVTSISPSPEQGDTTAWFEEHTKEIYHLPRFLVPEMWTDFLHYLVATKDVDLLWIAGSAFAYDSLRALRTAFSTLRVLDLLFNTVGHTANNRRRRDFIDVHVVESQIVRRWLLDNGESDSRIRVVESGVDLHSHRPALRSQEFRDSIGAGADELVISYCGRWSEEKDPLTFIEIARRIPVTWPVRFVMTGAGPLAGEIRSSLEGAALPPGRFHLIGEVKDIVSVLASTDVLVIPSRLDGRPVVAMEALACGTPVLATRVGGLPALIEHGRTGWICEPGDVGDFIHHLSTVVTNRHLLADMRRLARTWAEERLDITTMLTSYRTIVEEILRPPAPGTLTPEGRHTVSFAHRVSAG